MYIKVIITVAVEPSDWSITGQYISPHCTGRGYCMVQVIMDSGDSEKGILGWPTRLLVASYQASEGCIASTPG